MGTFAETANVDYRLSFADQGKQTAIFHFRLRKQRKFSIFVFRLQQTNRSCRFPLVQFSQIENGRPDDFL
jgi:hypothetical protein